jgi:glycosyltransferase involved in cell wall biosynthesis
MVHLRTAYEEFCLKEVVFIGMDLLPPFNEICSKLADSLLRTLAQGRPYRVLSLVNPGVEMAAPPNHRYVTLAATGKLTNAAMVAAALLRYASPKKSIVHFLMPARHTTYVTFLIRLCEWRGVRTVFTLLKNQEPQIRCAGNATALIAQTEQALGKVRSILPTHPFVELIHCGTAEQASPGVERESQTALFIGVPWRRGDFKRRGIELFFDTVARSAQTGDSIDFLLQNRALPHAEEFDRRAARLSADKLRVQHGSVTSIADAFSAAAVFLCLHTDDQCPDPPLSVIEACACGCPVVSTRFNSLAEDIESAGAGEIVEPTAEGILAGIRRILANPEPYRAAALKLGREKFSEQVFALAYERIYARLDEL